MGHVQCSGSFVGKVKFDTLAAGEIMSILVWCMGGLASLVVTRRASFYYPHRRQQQLESSDADSTTMSQLIVPHHLRWLSTSEQYSSCAVLLSSCLQQSLNRVLHTMTKHQLVFTFSLQQSGDDQCIEVSNRRMFRTSQGFKHYDVLSLIFRAKFPWW